MKNSKTYKGISLIVLVITIIVMIIIAGAIIISLTNGNVIAKAKEAKFKSDMQELTSKVQSMYLEEYTAAMGQYYKGSMNGNISSFGVSAAYDSEYSVVGGTVCYKGNDLAKIEVAKDLGIITGVVNPTTTLPYNKPDLSYLPTATTVAIKWDGSNVESNLTLAVADADTTWYDYTTKKWSNIKTSNNGNDAYWVWIPRYAYKIDHPHTTTAEPINIKFLGGATNTPADGSTLPDDYIVHPAFTFGDKQLSGIWVAKYEASSETPNITDGSGYTGGGNTAALQVRILPNVYSWRNISAGNIQTVSMNMVSAQGSIGTTTNLDSHQMKNIEWGAVAYLAQSIYGQEPWVNPYGDSTASAYKLKTGYSGASKDCGALAEGNVSLNQYNTTNGVKASTTGNIYGVYDMSGGAWEYVAAYIDNGNGNIGSYGTSTYFTSNILKTQYSKYYNTYEPGDQEKFGAAYYGAGTNILWAADNSLANNTLRKSLTDATYEKMKNSKGDAIYEVSNGGDYYGKDGNNTSNWLKNASDTTTSNTMGWNLDYQFYGYASFPWLLRGGYFGHGSGAGLFFSFVYYGCPVTCCGFRPVLALGSGI